MSVKQVNADMVHLGGLSYETRRAIESYSSAHGYDEMIGDRLWLSLHNFAWLVAMLSAETDTPELFPKGKWATLQRLQVLMHEGAVETIRVRKGK
jgi:hypothetical protein